MSEQTLTVRQFNDGVRLLAQSSRDLAARFGQQRTVSGQIALIREELAEVLAATDDAHRVEELCDLIVVWCGGLDAVGMKTPRLRKHLPQRTIPRVFRVEVLGNIENAYKAFRIVYDYLLTIQAAADLFLQQVAAVVAKNAAKTEATHYLDATTGKITRKAVQS